MNNFRSRSLAAGVNSSSTPTKSTDPTLPLDNSDSDFVVILAALLCALICVLGLIAVARCAWIRRLSDRVLRRPSPAPPAANKGLKKKVLKTFPKLTYDEESSAAAGGKFTECAICLAEFVAGDELRVLPQCGHGFHVGCIDTWLESHSSCPSCRQILVMPGRCKKCGELSVNSASGASSGTRRTEIPVNQFLP